MLLPRNENGRVTLFDLVANKTHVCTPASAMEILGNPNCNGRYVTMDQAEEAKKKRELDEAVKAEVALRAGQVIDAEKSLDDVSADLITAHNAIVEEGVEGDERLTKTGAVKLAVLKEAVGRDIERKEHTAYVKALSSASE